MIPVIFEGKLEMMEQINRGKSILFYFIIYIEKKIPSIRKTLEKYYWILRGKKNGRF